MGLFTRNFDKPGPGVSPDAPRKKGAARFFEILGRDFSTIWLELFSLCHINIAGGHVAVIAVLLAIILLAGIAQYLYVQVALLDLSFAGLLKNSLMLFLGYLPRSGLGLLWQLLYWGAVALFWPISSFVLILTSLWLPCLLSLMAIYPVLEKSFDIEKKIKAIREAQLHGDDDQ